MTTILVAVILLGLLGALAVLLIPSLKARVFGGSDKAPTLELSKRELEKLVRELPGQYRGLARLVIEAENKATALRRKKEKRDQLLDQYEGKKATAKEGELDGLFAQFDAADEALAPFVSDWQAAQRRADDAEKAIAAAIVQLNLTKRRIETGDQQLSLAAVLSGAGSMRERLNELNNEFSEFGREQAAADIHVETEKARDERLKGPVEDRQFEELARAARNRDPRTRMDEALAHRKKQAA